MRADLFPILIRKCLLAGTIPHLISTRLRDTEINLSFKFAADDIVKDKLANAAKWVVFSSQIEYNIASYGTDYSAGLWINAKKAMSRGTDQIAHELRHTTTRHNIAQTWNYDQNDPSPHLTKIIKGSIIRLLAEVNNMVHEEFEWHPYGAEVKKLSFTDFWGIMKAKKSLDVDFS